MAPQQPPAELNSSVGGPTDRIVKGRRSKRTKGAAAAAPDAATQGLEAHAQIKPHPAARKLGQRQTRAERRLNALNECRIKKALSGKCDCGNCASQVRALGIGLATTSVAAFGFN